MSKSTALKKVDTSTGEIVEFDPTNLESMEGYGTEAATGEDYALPFLSIAQGLSPQIEEGDAKYIEGLKKGEFFNTVTSEYWKNVTVIPVMFERKWLEFKLREEGGGLVNIYDNQSNVPATVRDEMNRDITAEGTQIVDTRSFYCIQIKEDGSTENVLISLKATQAKKAKQWLSMIRNIKLPRASGNGYFNPPMFSHTYELSAAKEENAKGSWHGYVIGRGVQLPVEEEAFQEAVAFFKMLSDGAVNVNYAAMDGEATEVSDDIPL